MAKRSFIMELRKRKVVQAAAIYGAVAWGVTEVLVTVVEQLFLPQWVSTLAVIGFVVGFPVAMFLSWTFDITAGGIERTTVTSRRGKASIVASLLLLIAGTAGLFFLIRPSLELNEATNLEAEILPNSIAVLPFENAGLDPRDAYLGEGLSDEVRDQLGRVAGIRVAARSSSKVAVEQRLGAVEASVRLGVANIVEGSIRRQGSKLRISVQLIDGASGLTTWSYAFDRTPRELLSVQQAIAEQVVAHVLPGSDEVPTPTTQSVSANDAMLLARFYEQQVRDQQIRDDDKLLEAIRLYRKAVEADPESALAHSRLAGALLFLGDIDSAEASARVAMLLDPIVVRGAEHDGGSLLGPGSSRCRGRVRAGSGTQPQQSRRVAPITPPGGGSSSKSTAWPNCTPGPWTRTGYRWHVTRRWAITSARRGWRTRPWQSPGASSSCSTMLTPIA